MTRHHARRQAPSRTGQPVNEPQQQDELRRSSLAHNLSIVVAARTFSYKSEQLHKAGAPICTIDPPADCPHQRGRGITRCTSHPNAAVLLYDLLLTQAPVILAPRDMVSTDPKGRGTAVRRRLHLHGPLQMLDDGRRWNELWDRPLPNRNANEMVDRGFSVMRG